MLAVILFPIAEELFKFICAKLIPQFAFGTIVSFALFEFALVKAPLFDAQLELYILDMLLVSVAAMTLHVGTAYVYVEKSLRKFQFQTLVVMILLHSLYNYLGEIDMPRIMLLVVTAISCLLPLVYLYAAKLFLRNDIKTNL